MEGAHKSTLDDVLPPHIPAPDILSRYANLHGEKEKANVKRGDAKVWACD